MTRPRDPAQLAALVGKMATGVLPNDKDEILNPPEPSDKAKAASTPRTRTSSTPRILHGGPPRPSL